MSFLNWFSSKKPTRAVVTDESSGLARVDATRPVAQNRQHSASAPRTELAANRKTERMARRELLYKVIRESMVRAGVLSASYKFKVLSLDQRGRQFLVMVDLDQKFGGETARLAEIEVMIAQHAKTRFDIVVRAVYWRMNEHVAIGRLQPAAATSAPAPLMAVPLSMLSSRHPAPTSRYEPIQADEVAAFQRALAAASSVPAAKGSAVQRNYTLLTGYEDTELRETEVDAPALGGTQYGELA